MEYERHDTRNIWNKAKSWREISNSGANESDISLSRREADKDKNLHIAWCLRFYAFAEHLVIEERMVIIFRGNKSKPYYPFGLIWRCANKKHRNDMSLKIY